MTDLAKQIAAEEQAYRGKLLQELVDDAQSIIEMKRLNPTQRLILHYLQVSMADEPTHQRELCDKLGLVMKTVRLNLRVLHKMGMVAPGDKSFTWWTNMCEYKSVEKNA